MNTRRKSLIALALTLALAGCGGDGGTPDAGATDTEAAGPTVPEGELSVADAKASDAEGPLTVNGFVFVREVQWILCNRLDEISYPPECSGGSLRVANPAALAALKLTEGIGQAHGLRWTETPVSLLGSVEGDAFRVTEIVKG